MLGNDFNKVLYREKTMCNGGIVLKYLINFLKYISYIIVIIFVFIIGYDILHQCLIYEGVYIPLFVLWMVTYTSQFLLQEKIRKQTMTEEEIILFKKKRAEDIHWLRAREDFYKSLGLITIGCIIIAFLIRNALK